MENIEDQDSINFNFEIKLNSQKDNQILQDLSSLNLFDQTKLENRSLNSFDLKLNQNYAEQDLDKNVPRKNMQDFEALSFYFNSKQKSNGYLINKINPILDTEFSYMNRNKLVNRRLVLKKSKNQANLNSNPTLNEINTEYMLENPFNLYIKLFPNQQELDQKNKETQEKLNNTFMSDINNEELSYLENKNYKQRKWYTNEAKKFYRPSKSSSIVLIEKKTYKQNKSDTPGPLSYHIPRRPPNEKISPVYSFGKRVFKEKSGGGRVSWEKEWFNSNNPFLIKSNFNRESIWPAPNCYRIKSSLGTGPSFTIGQKINEPEQKETEQTDKEQKLSIILAREDIVESELKRANFLKTKDLLLFNKNKKNLNELNVMESFNQIGLNAPKVSIKFRQKGTQLWPENEKTPGPGSYDLNKFKNIAKQAPKYSQPHAKLDLNSKYSIGPYAAI